MDQDEIEQWYEDEKEKVMGEYLKELEEALYVSRDGYRERRWTDPSPLPNDIR